VYGALVIVCLGSVVWGLTFALDGVFPIHWSSNEPVLEFPVDLLVYNFLMPLAVKFIRPSKGLHKMYDWWFRKCARWLRLSHFMFGEKRSSEEGHIIRGRWWNPLPRLRKDPPQVDEKESAVGFVKDGRYVRTPASDQVRIPKGRHTFVDVDQEHHRLDGLPETDDGLHGRENPLFTEVYIPPYFRLRISAFIVLIWVFAATTGVGITIIPLICGRRVFAYLIPSHRRMNDIYAFSIGVYLLGSPLYLLVRYRTDLTSLLRNVSHRKPSSLLSISTLLPFARSTLHYALHTLRLAYFYGAFTIVLPSLFALLMEAYVVIPLHTYFSTAENAPPAPHTIHFIQDWTLAVLYLKMAARLVLWRANTRQAAALRAIVRAPHGWLEPDIRLATRAVILPATVAMVVALIVPLGLGKVLSGTVLRESGDLATGAVYRYAYPAFAAVGLGLLGCAEVRSAVRAWRGRIRDEVYLIGERLHNFGERRGGGRVGRVRGN
jgi:E3 ubiquitin-protein ligase MARCH6